MLYTAYVSVFEKTGRKMKPYYLIRNHGNDAVIPDKSDLDQYWRGELTWNGLQMNYLGKLMRSEAEEWMSRVAAEAAKDDVVLVSDEEDVEHCFRILLAEMMMNMFSGEMNLGYEGELK
jgi:hypothetical protein